MNHGAEKLYVHHLNGCKPVGEADTDTTSFMRGIYGEQPIYHFRNSAFNKQMNDLLTRYQQLGSEFTSYFSPFDSTVSSIAAFQFEFLSKSADSKYYDYRQKNDVQYFKSIKSLLEDNYCLLVQKKENNLALAKSCLKSLVGGFVVCAPGLLGHLEEAKLRLSSNQSIWFWMAELRTRLVETYADIHTQNKNLDAGLHVHVWMAYIKYANQMGYHLVKSSQKDKFERLADISRQDLRNLKKYLHKEYTPEAILECAEHNIRNMICEFMIKYTPEEKKESSGLFAWLSAKISGADSASKRPELGAWLDISSDLYAQMMRDGGALLKTLQPLSVDEVDVSQLFELNEESTKLRIQPTVLKDLKAFIKPQLIALGILTTDKKEDLFLTKSYLTVIAQAIGSRMGFIKQWLRYSIAGAAIFGGYALKAAINGGRFVISDVFLKGVMATQLVGVLDRVRDVYKRASYDKFQSEEHPTLEDKIAFQDGVQAQESCGAQINTLFKWNDYKHCDAYYAGMQAKCQYDQALQDKFRLG